MLESKYEGNITIRRDILQVAILNDDKHVVTESSVRGMLYDYKHIVEELPNIITYENLQGKSIKGYLVSDFITICENYNGRRISNVLAQTVIDLSEQFNFSKVVEHVVGYEINQMINQFVIWKDSNEEIPSKSEFDSFLLRTFNTEEINNK